ncbi:MAG: hypothetical protein WA958_02195 [Tunicatimonas sp.]
MRLAASAQSIHFSDDENFAFKVKQIDEFMDRFNAVADTPIQQYVREQYAIDSLSRASLVLSLFNQEDTSWNEPQVREFVADVAQSTARLNFYDRGWYAELDCTGRYRGQEEQFTLVLSLEVLRPGQGSKWVIEGVSADFLRLGYSKDRRRALNPGSYGTDFMGLVDALRDTANVRNYLSTRAQPSQLLLFFNELCEGQLVFKRVRAITYHFLQIDNWIFKVRDFKRDLANSGWLISDLMKVTDVQKLQYRETMLYLD